MKLLEKIEKLKIGGKISNTGLEIDRTYVTGYNDAIINVKEFLKQELKDCYKIKLLPPDDGYTFYCRGCNRTEKEKEKLHCGEDDTISLECPDKPYNEQDLIQAIADDTYETPIDMEITGGDTVE
jgi:hypothetical protein